MLDKKFKKAGTKEDGYFEIWYQKAFTMVHGSYAIDSMKNLHSFCNCNNLPSGRIAKLQGGYYILTDNNKWEFIERTLYLITFKTLYDLLSVLTHPTKGRIYGN